MGNSKIKAVAAYLLLLGWSRKYLPEVQLVTPVKFELGDHIELTPGAKEVFETSGEDPYGYIQRHVQGDWGDMDDFDRKQNEYALVNGLRLVSIYHLGNGTKIYIITEADRSSTTILLPDEY